jgi:hypothetical protein
MGLRSVWREKQQVRRSVIGAISGLIAGITAAGIEGTVVERYGVAIAIGLIAFVGLLLLVD